jgi:protein FAM50
MYADGYVGTSQDAQRIRRQQKQREQQREAYEAQQAKIREQAAGLRQFGASTAEALENAFKNETVGLVTLEEFVQKRTTLQERLEQEELNKQLQAKAAAAEEKERRRKEKAKKKPKLSFALDVSSLASCRLV